VRPLFQEMASQPENTLSIFFIIRSRPLDACLDELVHPWAPLWRPEQVICRLHVQARKNRCHDSEHSLSTFIHGRAPDRGQIGTSRNFA